jgi:hypothetical protein
MFFAAFGGAWLGLWAFSEFWPSWGILIAIAATTAGLVYLAWRTYATNSKELRGQPRSPDEARRSRIFNYINAGQWVLIFVLVALLNQFRRSDYILPMIIFVTGAHFLPLASLFESRSHAVTGVALITWSLGYSLWPGVGPANAVGALGTGIILWVTAGWALRPTSEPQNGV